MWAQPDAEKMSISACRGNRRQPSFAFFLLFFSPYAAAAVANNATDRRKSRKRPRHMAFVASRMQQPPQSVAQLSSFFSRFSLANVIVWAGRKRERERKRKIRSQMPIMKRKRKRKICYPPQRYAYCTAYPSLLTWHTFNKKHQIQM